MKHCKIYLLCLTSWLLLSPTHLSAGGGDFYSPFYIDKGFNILPPSLTSRRSYKRSGYSSGTYYSETSDEALAREKFNVQAWSEFLKRDTKESKDIVYGGTIPKDLDAETKAYLNAVRMQEPLVTQPQKEQPPYNLAIEKLTTALADTKADFLRQRYIFLILRLAHYSKQYDKVAALYAQFLPERQHPSAEIGYWIDALQAGALQRIGKRAEAAYRFASIFRDSKTRRLEAQLNFKIKTDEEWEALLALCQNNNEKALMYFIRSLKTKANSLQELETIYALAPDSQWVDEALIRELEYVQFAKDMRGIPGSAPWHQITSVNHEQLIADSKGDPKLLEQTKQRRVTYLAELSELAGKIQTDKKRKDLFLSDYAALYLKLLQKQVVTVQEVNDFQATYPDDARLAATKPLEYFVYLESLKTIDEPTEQQISTYLKQLMPLYRSGEEYGDDRSDFSLNIMDYTYIKLEPLYLQQKEDWQPAKTYAAKNRGTVTLDNMLVVELLDFQKLLKEKSSRHSLLLTDMMKSMRETNERYSLDEAIARKYLAANMPEKALAALAKTPKQTLAQLSRTYNPFNTSLSGNNRKPGSPKSLRKVIETLQTLQKQVKENPKDAQAYFLLGTLHYNMSWFGNSPMLLRYYRQTSNWLGGQIDMTTAKDYYQRALKHSNNRNLTAKTLYALAKIEQVNFFTKNNKKGNHFTNRQLSYRDAVLKQKAQGFGKYLGKLKAYEDTNYFSQVISQCADYGYFHSQ